MPDAPHPDAARLDARLAAETVPLGDLPVSRALLMDDARYPWIVLVPHRAGLVELTDLTAHERAALMEEIALAASALRDLSGCDKLNAGALGNIVRQLHVHVVARFEADPAWPGPVWGVGTRVPYEAPARERTATDLRRRLSLTAAA